MRLVVTGGRDFTQLCVIEGALRTADERYGIDVLIHGGAPGVDSLCADWAARNDKLVITYKGALRVHPESAVRAG